MSSRQKQMVSQELRDKGSRVEIVEEKEDVTSENNNVIAKICLIFRETKYNIISLLNCLTISVYLKKYFFKCC